eukprot:CAMPEP_0114677500 /NCGR_PEP_ID=MMETSP0191-20121206/50604_1 /TAXON_ID=126664 /ORGANISM="Sorites sp." /LENGTH=163 /DNA_ID=CAMNT_0001950173 /DNA_START=108 /DNA_END=596 /DNA_ORIENTATION=-
MITAVLVVIIGLGYGYKHRNKECMEDGIAKVIFDESNNGIKGEAYITESGYFLAEIDITGFNQTICENDGGNDEFGYHIHDDFNDRITDECGPEYTAGHFNPYNVPVCSALNDYEEITYYNCEVGDLSGRFGYVQNVNNLLEVYPQRISQRACDPIITPDVVW